MASTYTSNNGIEKPGTGDQAGTWGDTVNTNMDLLDEALEGSVTVSLPGAGSTGAPNSFAISDGSTSAARHKFVTFSDAGDLGGIAYVQLTPNDASKIYFIKNSLSASRALVLFQGTYDAGRAVQINAGETYLIAFDGAGASATCTKIGEIPTTTGTIASQDANDVTITGGSISGVTVNTTTFSSPSVTITGGTITGITDLTIADGGTGASTAAGARSNLGLAIGSDVQGHDANLAQIAALTPTDGNFVVGNGSAWVTEDPATVLTSLGITASAAEINNLDGITPAGAALLDDANAAAQRSTLGLTEGIVTTDFASQAEAEAGQDNTKLMTPLLANATANTRGAFGADYTITTYNTIAGRTRNTAYQNLTGRVMYVTAYGRSQTNSWTEFQLSFDGSSWTTLGRLLPSTWTAEANVNIIVPPGAYWRCTAATPAGTITEITG